MSLINIGEFLPIEFRGMSFLTVIFIIILIIGGRSVYLLLKQEVDRINEQMKKNIKDFNEQIDDTNKKVDLLSKKVDETNSDLTIIKVHVAKTHEAVEWIKRYLYKGNKD